MSQVKLSGKSLVIQIDSEHIRIAQTVLGTASPQLFSQTVTDTPAGAVDDGILANPEAVKTAIRDTLERAGLSRLRQVVFSLCTSQVITEEVKTPRVSGSKLDALLQANLDVYFPVDVKDYIIAYEKAGDPESRDEPELTLRLWATPRSLVAPYYAVANGLGLSVAAIEWFGRSLVSSVGASFAPNDVKKQRRTRRREETEVPSDSVAAESDAAMTTLYMDAEPEFLLMSFVKNRQVMMQRLLHRDSSSFSEAQIVLDYYRSTDAGRYSNLRGVLVGSLRDLPEYSEQLQRELEIPIQIDGGGMDPAWYLCTGAAMTNLDFGAPSYNRVARASDQVHQLWQYALVLLGGVAIVGAVLGIIFNRTTWNSRISGELSKQEMLMMQTQVEANRYADVREQQEAYNNEYRDYLGNYIYYSRAYDNLFGETGDKAALENAVRTYNANLALMLEELEGVLPAGASVLTIGIGDEGMGLEFSCASKEEAAQLIQELRGLDYATLERVSGLSLQRSGGTTGYAMLPSLQAMLEAEKAAEAERQQALLEAQMAEAAGDTNLSENVEEAPPTEGSATDNYTLAQKQNAISSLVASDDEGWDLLLQAMIDEKQAMDIDPDADENSAFFNQMVAELRNMVSAGESPLSNAEMLGLAGAASSVKDAVNSGDKAALHSALDGYRGSIAKLMTANETMVYYSENFLTQDPLLWAKYKSYLPISESGQPIVTTDERRKAAIKTLIGRDDDAWGYFIDAIINQKDQLENDLSAEQGRDFLRDMGDMTLSILDSAGDALTPAEKLDAWSLAQKLKDAKDAVNNRDAQTLSNLLKPHRATMASLMTSNQEALDYTEDFILSDPWLQAKYNNYLADANLNTGEVITVDEPTDNTGTNTGSEGNSLVDLLSQLLNPNKEDENKDKDGNDSTLSPGGSGGIGGVVTQADGTIYFGAILRYNEELIQMELESKETAIEPQEKLPMLEQFTAGGDF